MAKSRYSIRYDRGWGIYLDGQLVEGGFFSKAAAEDYFAKEYS